MSKQSNISWYIAAVVVVVVIVVVGVLSYELTLPNVSVSPTGSPTATPTSSATGSTSPTSSSSPTISSSPTSAPSGGTSLTLYAGSVTSGSGTYGYGDSSSNIVSPGPTLNLKMGTTYTMTVNNVANIPHSWEISQTKAVTQSPMFGAGIDINSYIAPGTSGSVSFTPDQTGDFYYVCTVPGHITLGMWGNVHITS